MERQEMAKNPKAGPKKPSIAYEFNSRKIKRRLEKEGWEIVRTEGDHHVMKHPNRKGRILMSPCKGFAAGHGEANLQGCRMDIVGVWGPLEGGGGMKKYMAVVHQEGDSAYGVWFPDLPGCFAAGDTEDEAVASAKRSLMLYAEDAIDDGEELPVPRTLHELRNETSVREALDCGGFVIMVPLIVNSGRVKRVSLDFDAALVDTIDEVSKECNLTRKAWVEQVVRDFIFAYETGVKNTENVVRLTHTVRGRTRAYG
jgi:predicted RNase H-like HicB family nuclease/predicted RNA binding protein YcfA (HicA-like mRNA interferase family)